MVEPCGKRGVRRMSEKPSFTWLHMSDLHVGMAAQDWMWPTVKNALLQDLEALLPKIGPVNAVIFSGDLTQRAAKDEFAKLDEVLKELRDALAKLGCTAPLLVVPGNHDLA